MPPGHVVADFREALGRVGAVDVVTPAGSHAALAVACLHAGRHCFIEKPLAMTTMEGATVARARDAAARVVQVGHIFRFHPVTVTVAVREALGAGGIGAVRYARARFAGFKRPRTDAGITHADAIHFFDLFAHLLDRDATAVASLQRDVLGRGLDDVSVTVVHYGEADYFAPGTYRECLIVGDTGSLVADYGAGSVTLHAGQHRRRGAEWEAVDTGKEALPVEDGEPLRRELAAFIAACSGRAATPVSVEDGIRALEIVEAAACAAQRERTVRLDELR